MKIIMKIICRACLLLVLVFSVEGFVNKKLGADWTKITHYIDNKGNEKEITGHLVGVVYGKGKFLVASSAGYVLSRDRDGKTDKWKRIDFAGERVEFSRINYVNNMFSVVNGNGDIFTSYNGEDWYRQELRAQKWLSAVAYSPMIDRYSVSDGGSGHIYESEDFKTWTTVKVGKNLWFTDVIAVGTSFYTVGGLWDTEREIPIGVVFVGTRPANWSRLPLDIKNSLRGISYVESIGYVVVGDKGNIYRSDDGRIWHKPVSMSSPASRIDFLAVRYFKNAYHIVGTEQSLYTSLYGERWKKMELPAGAAHLTDVDHAGGTTVITGRDGVLLVSETY